MSGITGQYVKKFSDATKFVDEMMRLGILMLAIRAGGAIADSIVEEIIAGTLLCCCGAELIESYKDLCNEPAERGNLTKGV